VSAFVTRDDLGEVSNLAAQGAVLDGFAVEAGLQVLQEQREVEDLRVERLRRRRRRLVGTPAEECACAEREPAGDGAAAEKVTTGPRDVGGVEVDVVRRRLPLGSAHQDPLRDRPQCRSGFQTPFDANKALPSVKCD
jgi:hypothetical protein